MRLLDETAIQDIALGASLLGAGGGGDPYIGKLMALSAVREHGPVKLISMDEVPDEDLVVPVAMMGAPAVMTEKLPNGQEFVRAFKALERNRGKKVFATLPIEAGGVNSMVPIAVAAQLGLPMVDADGMGRAFPELQMVTFHLHGISAAPMTMTDEKGNNVLLEVINNKWAENIARSVTVAMGATAMVGLYSMNGAQLKQSGIGGIISYSEQIGRIIREARQSGESPTRRLAEFTGGFHLFQGKIEDVERNTQGGFNRGVVRFAGIDDDKGRMLEVDFQNENLIARIDGEPVAMTPDLICLLDMDTGVPLTTESLKYGRRAHLLALPCHEQWRTEKGIATVGPRYFGYDYDYVPVETLAKRRGAR
jgi:hypothetical protein